MYVDLERKLSKRVIGDSLTVNPGIINGTDGILLNLDDETGSECSIKAFGPQLFIPQPALVFLSSCAFAAAAVAVPNTPRQNSLPPPFSGTHSGDGTFFEPGLGACGVTNGPNDLIVAVSAQLYDSFPGATPNPNNNPICQESITASFEGKSVTVKVVDRCTGCAEFDLDFSPAAFTDLAGDLSIGRIHGVSWFFD